MWYLCAGGKKARKYNNEKKKKDTKEIKGEKKMYYTFFCITKNDKETLSEKKKNLQCEQGKKLWNITMKKKKRERKVNGESVVSFSSALLRSERR